MLRQKSLHRHRSRVQFPFQRHAADSIEIADRNADPGLVQQIVRVSKLPSDAHKPHVGVSEIRPAPAHAHHTRSLASIKPEPRSFDFIFEVKHLLQIRGHAGEIRVLVPVDQSLLSNRSQ